jgi:hypothetical protein
VLIQIDDLPEGAETMALDLAAILAKRNPKLPPLVLKPSGPSLLDRLHRFMEEQDISYAPGTSEGILGRNNPKFARHFRPQDALKVMSWLQENGVHG